MFKMFKTAMGRVLTKPGNQRNKKEDAEASDDDTSSEDEDRQAAAWACTQRERAKAAYNTFLEERDQFLKDHPTFDDYCRRSNCSLFGTYHKKEYQRQPFNERSAFNGRNPPGPGNKRDDMIRSAKAKWTLQESEKKRASDAREAMREQEFKALQIQQLAKMKAAFLAEETKSVEEGSEGEDTEASSADESDSEVDRFR
jgi:hypothetical protein